tara:strand:+ start:2369 stop:2650 length:282 start_codon:yes stop_codon:yes gene_type:complete
MEANKMIRTLIKQRLEEGNVTFGKEMNTKDSRDFLEESLEELLDACIYLSLKLIQTKISHGKLRMDEIINPKQMKSALLKAYKKMENENAKSK